MSAQEAGDGGRQQWSGLGVAIAQVQDDSLQRLRAISDKFIASGLAACSASPLSCHALEKSV